MSFPAGELGSERIVQGMEWNTEIRAERLQEMGVTARLSIISVNLEDRPSATYMRLKRNVGRRLGIEVHAFGFSEIDDARQRIEDDNQDPRVNGIIVQLPLHEEDVELTDEILASVAPSKDVDGLAPESPFVPATVRATEAWFKGHNIDYLGTSVALVGLGRLVNGPFYRRLETEGAAVVGLDKDSDELTKVDSINRASIVVSATGHPGLLTPDLFLPNTEPKVLVDIGTAEQSGSQEGDVSDALRAYAIEKGWAITPKKGGIGKITVRALFANLIDAAEAQTGVNEPVGDYRMRQSMEATSSARPADLFPRSGGYQEGMERPGTT